MTTAARPASQSQLYGCDWLVRPPGLQSTEQSLTMVDCSQQAPNLPEKVLRTHPLTVTASLFSPLSPLHSLRDGAPIGIANNATALPDGGAGQLAMAASRPHSMQHRRAARGMTIVRTANLHSYSCTVTATGLQLASASCKSQSAPRL
jgi:hypothetical protein